MARNQPRHTQAQRVSSLEFGPNLPAFRALQFNTIQSIPNNIETPLVFDVWENCNDNVFAPHLNGGGDLDYIQALIEGVYSIHWEWEFDTEPAAAATFFVGMAIEECFGCWTEAPIVNYKAQFLAGNNSTGHYSQDLVRGYPPLWLHLGQATPSNAPSTPEWHFNVLQNSGVAQDVTLGYVEIYLLGGLSCDTSELGE